jgi:hypothetical protein
MSTSYNIEWKTSTNDCFAPKTTELVGVKTNDHPLKTAFVSVAASIAV